MTYNVIKSAATFAKNSVYVFLGIIFVVFIAIYLILSSPIFLYRWILTKWVAPRFRHLGKAVHVNASMLTGDFLTLEKPPRGTIVVNLLLEGNLSFEDFCDRIKSVWVDAKDERGRLKYPEFQQYMESWAGFMFWNHDKTFDIKNHVKLHKIAEDASESEAEQDFQELNEELINKRYTPKRSPWEVQLVQNYKNSELLPPTNNTSEIGQNSSNVMTVVIFRIHHAMADGFAIMHLLVEQLCGEYEEHPVWTTGGRSQKRAPNSLLKRFFSLITYPLQILREGGNLILMSVKTRTLYHIPDRKKTWRQIYGRAPLINIAKIKYIKNTFGVSFAAVVNSCLTAGLAKMLKDLMESRLGRGTSMPKELMFGNAVPTTAHPKKLRNHALGVAFVVPIEPGMIPLERLHICEKLIQKAKSSPMAMLSGFGLTIFSSNLVKLTKYILRNRYIATAASSFPGPGRPLVYDKKYRVVAVDFSAGALNGVAGVGFMCLSNAEQFRICATAENAVMSRDELDQLLIYIGKEFDALYMLAKKNSDSDSCCEGEV